MTRFSVVVVTWNSAHELPDLLESVDRLMGNVCEFVFVDNASQDNTVEVLRTLAPDSKVIVLPRNVGFGPANNIGVREAAEDVVILLNPDTVVVDQSLVRLAQLARDERGLFAPRLLNIDGSSQISARPALASVAGLLISVWPGRLMPRRLRDVCEPWRSQRRLPAGWISGACLAARRSLLEQLGPFDERLPMYGEDADLSMRAWELGIPSISAPDVARIVHVGGRSANQAFSDIGVQRKIQVRWWLVDQHHGSMRGWLDLGAEFLLYGTRWVAKRTLGRPATNEAHWLRVAARVAREGRPTLPPQLPDAPARPAAPTPAR